MINKRKKLFHTVTLAALLGIAGSAQAVLIDFTGGTVTRFSQPSPVTTDTTAVYDDVDFYTEGGMKFDFIGPPGNPFSYNIGDYYGIGNDVIHGHWEAGPFGDMTGIRAEKLDGTAFDLNYFKITTNTCAGGGPACGTEEVFLNALADGVTVSFSMLLPPDDWGFAGPNSEIFLGPEFDGIKAFTVTYGSIAVGFGMDEFFIDEPPPGGVPVPATLALMGLGLAGIGYRRRKRIQAT